MNSTEGAPLQAAGYLRHSVEILPVGDRRKRRGIAQLAMNADLKIGIMRWERAQWDLNPRHADGSAYDA